MFPAGGHLGSESDMLDTIFKGDHQRTIVTTFGSNWYSRSRREESLNFSIGTNVKLCSPLAAILDYVRTSQDTIFKWDHPTTIVTKVWFPIGPVVSEEKIFKYIFP